MCTLFPPFDLRCPFPVHSLDEGDFSIRLQNFTKNLLYVRAIIISYYEIIIHYMNICQFYHSHRRCQAFFPVILKNYPRYDSLLNPLSVIIVSPNLKKVEKMLLKKWNL